MNPMIFRDMSHAVIKRSARRAPVVARSSCCVPRDVRCHLVPNATEQELDGTGLVQRLPISNRVNALP